MTHRAADTNGTTANLKAHDMLTVNELMYGLMLPSGNDAAECLALYFGALIMHKQTGFDANTWLNETDDVAVESRIAE